MFLTLRFSENVQAEPGKKNISLAMPLSQCQSDNKKDLELLIETFSFLS